MDRFFFSDWFHRQIDSTTYLRQLIKLKRCFKVIKATLTGPLLSLQNQTRSTEHVRRGWVTKLIGDGEMVGVGVRLQQTGGQLWSGCRAVCMSTLLFVPWTQGTRPLTRQPPTIDMTGWPACLSVPSPPRTPSKQALLLLPAMVWDWVWHCSKLEIWACNRALILG